MKSRKTAERGQTSSPGDSYSVHPDGGTKACGPTSSQPLHLSEKPWLLRYNISDPHDKLGGSISSGEEVSVSLQDVLLQQQPCPPLQTR